MVNNLKCDTCRFMDNCIPHNKLKPFYDEKKDFGVDLTMDSCRFYMVSEDAPDGGEIDPEDDDVELH